MRIIAIVVTYNGSKWIDKCFGSLVLSSIPMEILAIDNGSSDNTPELIKQKFPQVEIIETGENLGFGRANNLGLKRALDKKADFAFLLNQDAWIKNETIAELIKVYDKNPDYGILSPIHLNGQGNAIDPKFASAIVKQNPKFINDAYFDTKKDTYEVTFVNAAIWLIPLKTLKIVGGFDTFFHMYGEDTDYCRRVLFHKLKIGVCTNVTAHHARDNSYYKKKKFFKDISFNVTEIKRFIFQNIKNVQNLVKYNIINLHCELGSIFISSFFKRKFTSLLAVIISYFSLPVLMIKAISSRKYSSQRRSSFLE